MSSPPGAGSSPTLQPLFPSDFPPRETAGVKARSAAGAFHPGCRNTRVLPVPMPPAPQDWARTGCHVCWGQQTFTAMKAALPGCTHCLNSLLEHPLKYQWTFEVLSFSHYTSLPSLCAPADVPPGLCDLQAYLHPDSAPDGRIPRGGGAFLTAPKVGFSHPHTDRADVQPQLRSASRWWGAGDVTVNSSFLFEVGSLVLRSTRV